MAKIDATKSGLLHFLKHKISIMNLKYIECIILDFPCFVVSKGLFCVAKLAHNSLCHILIKHIITKTHSQALMIPNLTLKVRQISVELFGKVLKPL